MEEIVDADLPFKEQEITREQAIEYFQKRNEPYKVELAQAIPEGERITLALARRVRRPLPRRPRQVDRRHQGLQAALGRRRLLARRFEEQDAPAHLRHRLRRQEAARRVHQAARRGGEARPPQARQGARPVRVPPVGRRARRSGCPRARSLYTHAAEYMRRLLARRRPATSRSRRRSSSTRSSGSMSGHWQHYADNMFKVKSEEQAFGIKPMNCPAHALIYQHGAAQLPRSADSLPRADAAASQRGLGHALGPDARARSSRRTTRTSTCAHDQIERGDHRLLALVARSTSSSASSTTMHLVDAQPREVHGRRRRVGQRRSNAGARRSTKNHIEYRSGARRRGLLRTEDRHPGDRRHRPQVAVRDHPARLRAARALRPAPTSARTTRAIGRWSSTAPSSAAFERFIAMLIEHYAGAFPTWLAPVQARAVVVSEKQEAFARDVAAKLLKARGITGRPRLVERQARRKDSARPVGEDPLHARRRRQGSRRRDRRAAFARRQAARTHDRGRAGRSLVRGSQASAIARPA